MNISVCGKVSVGKSSFINSFHSYVHGNANTWRPIATISLQRETFQPTKYELKGETYSFDYDGEICKNRVLRESRLDDLIIGTIEISPINKFVNSIIDFPGFDDNGDHRDCIGLIKKNMGDLLIFIVDANRAFMDKSEMGCFNELLEASNRLNINGIFNEVIVVVNKFDFEDDYDLNEIYKKIKVPVKVFRWCSYARFKELNIKEKSRSGGVTARCDIDNLMNFIQLYETRSLRENTELKFLCDQLANRPSLLKDLNQSDAINNCKLNLNINGMLITTFTELVMFNYFKNSEFSIFPDWCFNGAFINNNWQILINENFSFNGKFSKKEKMLYILKIYDFECQKLFQFINEHLISLCSAKNQHIRHLAGWQLSEFWELNEAYKKHCGLNSIIQTSKFPIKALNYFSVDLKKLIKNMYCSPNANVKF